MMADGSIFLDITLPNAPTWFYFSALLAVALFFKFTRLLSMRNLDVVMMFLLVPGLLLLIEAHGLQGKLPPEYRNPFSRPAHSRLDVMVTPALRRGVSATAALMRRPTVRQWLG